MPIKIFSKRIFLVVILASLMLIGILILNFLHKNSTTINPVYGPAAEQTSTEPLRLKIPSIGVDAFVEHVGIDRTGAMDTPENPDDVAWYKFGPQPGETGSAVIAGHYGWKNNIPAVFDNLDKLQIGNKIFVSDLNGITTTFIVREIRIYDKDAVATEVFTSSDGKIHLNLITCAGDWNNAEKSRSDRLVVFTDKE